jgi:DNA polymerase III subunit delta'
MSGVFTRLVGQEAVEAALLAAARAARGDLDHSPAGDGTMTHAWLITGPPGSGRSVAALCFAAALQCTSDGEPGCGSCRACTTTMAGTHADVRRVIPEGLSIGVDEMRAIVQIASRRPTTGHRQIVVIEDADRLTEGAANALLKVVEEPPPSTVFLLCAPSVDPEDIAVTLRSRCRHVALVTPSTEAIARVLVERDGLDADTANWATTSGTLFIPVTNSRNEFALTKSTPRSTKACTGRGAPELARLRSSSLTLCPVRSGFCS